MTPSAGTTNSPIKTGFWSHWFVSDYLVLGLTALLFCSFAPFTPGLATGETLLNILSFVLPLLIVAIGLTLVMISGGIDLSITSIIALTSVVGAKIMTGHTDGSSLWLGVGAMLGLGALLGAANGAVITLLRLPPFIVTLASMMFLSGFAVWFTQSKNIYNLPGPFLALGTQLPITIALCAALAICAHLLLRRTLYGRWLYATGQNATAAHISGVPTRSVVFSTYVCSGFCAALASVILTGRLETGSPVLGREMLLDVIGATVVGGTSLFGGKGKITWTLFGVLFLTLLDNTLNLLSLSHFFITIVKGSVILLAAVLDATRQRFSGRDA
jgi:ribose/xylose/arabinose/galactoside ABC-type transport system permease subunit